MEEALRAGKRTKLFDEDELDLSRPTRFPPRGDGSRGAAVAGARLRESGVRLRWWPSGGGRGEGGGQGGGGACGGDKGRDEQGRGAQGPLSRLGLALRQWIRSGSGRLLTLPLKPRVALATGCARRRASGRRRRWWKCARRAVRSRGSCWCTCGRRRRRPRRRVDWRRSRSVAPAADRVSCLSRRARAWGLIWHWAGQGGGGERGGQLEEEQHAQAEAALYGLEGTF